MKAYIFDLDGTLLDSLADLANACNALLAARGYPQHPRDAYRLFVGNGLENLVRRSLPADAPEHGTAALFQDSVQYVREYYSKTWHVDSRPYEGIPDMLATLAAQGRVLGVLSNKPHDWTVEIMGHFFPTTPFAIVRGSMPGVPRKPDAAAVTPVLERLGRAAGACVYVGDSDVDMYTAQASGMLGVGVAWGFRGAEELRAAGAPYLVDSPPDIVRLLPTLDALA